MEASGRPTGDVAIDFLYPIMRRSEKLVEAMAGMVFGVETDFAAHEKRIVLVDVIRHITVSEWHSEQLT